MNCALPNGKQRSLSRIASLTFLGSLTAAGFFAALVPLPARADDGEDSRHGHERRSRGFKAQGAALHLLVAMLLGVHFPQHFDRLHAWRGRLSGVREEFKSA